VLYSLTFIATSKESIMRSLLFGIVITLLFAFAGNVHAANDLDGKALLCGVDEKYYDANGLVFAGGYVTDYKVDGIEIIKGTSHQYFFKGTSYVTWGNVKLYRVNLKSRTYGTCRISTKQKIMEKLKDVIADDLEGVC